MIVFDHFRQKKPRADPTRIHGTSEFFFQIIGSILLHLRNLRDNCFEKKAPAHLKKNKWTTINPGVDYERPHCSFLIVKKRCEEKSDSASKKITFAFKTMQ